jgi:glutamyl/glutaminyl-tRNA synthetase
LNFRTPEYAHLPLIFGESRTKLSKRYNAKSIIEYKREGYLSEAILNFIALLGWNPGDEREIFYLNSLVKEFSLERVQKSPAILNPSRLDFLNGFYIRHKPIDELTELCLPYLIKDNLIEPPFDLKEKEISFFGKDVNKYLIKETKEEIPIEKIKKIIALYQERLKNLQEISKLTDFFFKEKLEYDKSLLKWKDIDDQNLDRLLDFLIEILSKIDEEDWNKDNLQKILVSEAENFAQSINKNKDRGYLLWALRVALTGKRESAPPFEIGEILGKEKTIKRIKEAKEKK